MQFELSIFQRFKGFTIFLSQNYLPLENKITEKLAFGG